MDIFVLVKSAINPMADCGFAEKLICDRKSKEGASVTQQSFSKDADINTIMSKYEKTGVLVNPLDPDSHRQPLFMDVSGIGDFQSVQDRIQAANAAFLTLPPAVRARFDNQAANAVEFMMDPKNVEDAVDLGLLPKESSPKYQAAMAAKKAAEEAAAAAAAGQAASGGASGSGGSAGSGSGA